jgi:hypothetical protein
LATVLALNIEKHFYLNDMNIKGKIFLFFLSLFLLRMTYCSYCTVRDMAGVYVNINYQYGNCPAETPCEIDTLILRHDLSFYNKYWGNGTYELSFQSITFSYEEMGIKAGYSANVKRDLWGNPKIMLNSDMNQYYKKIK